MRIAVTYENGQIFQHFGHTKAFAIFDAENGGIACESVLPADCGGHGALAGFLKQHNVEVLICGNIGQGAKDALADVGIRLVAGASGSAKEAAEAFLNGTLSHNPFARCSHRHEPGHTCGEDHQGCGGNGNCH